MATMQTGQSDPMAYTGEKPDVAYLVSEYQKCVPIAGRDGLSKSDEIRFCEWPGRNPDGKKHDGGGEEVFPWEGASDMRPFLADGIVNELVAVQVTSFWKSTLQPKAAMGEAAQSSVQLVDYIINRLLPDELTREVELSAQYRDHYGWMVLHPMWEQELGMKRTTVKLEELATIGMQLSQGAQSPEEQFMLQNLAVAILDPTMTDAVVPVLQWIYDKYAHQQVGDECPLEVPELKPASIRKALAQLREKGEAELAVPYLAKNQPKIIALQPYHEVFIPRDTTDLQSARVIFQREWVTEAELVARVQEQGYSQKWVDKAKIKKGQSSPFWAMPSEGANGTIKTSTEAQDNNLPVWKNSIELLHAVRRCVDSDGVPGIYLTTFHCGVKGEAGEELVAKHELLNYPHGEYPYVGGARENWCRAFTSARGVPEISATWQQQYKGVRDSILDRTSITLLPPINEPVSPMGTRYRFAPAVRNPVQGGKEPTFMKLPEALGLQEGQLQVAEIRKEADNYFGMMSEDVPPARYQTRQAMMVHGFLMTWSKALQQTVELCREYMSDMLFSDITGAPPGWLDARRDRPGLLAVDLAFDVRELDPEFVKERVAMLKEALATDSEGRMDRGRFTELLVRTIAPTWARQLIRNKAAASEAMWRGVRDDFAQMFLGNESKYVENDPAAQTKIEYAQQIIQANPNYAGALQQGGRFKELVEKWFKNLQMSIDQQDNKLVGKIGVKPGTQ